MKEFRIFVFVLLGLSMPCGIASALPIDNLTYSFSGTVDWENDISEHKYIGLETYGFFNITELDEPYIFPEITHHIQLESYSMYFDEEAYVVSGEEIYGWENSFSFTDIVQVETAGDGIRIFGAYIHEIEIRINWFGENSIYLGEAGVVHEFRISEATFATPVPEPATFILIATGLTGVAVRRKRKRHISKH